MFCLISAINKGKEIAKRNLVKVSIINGTIPHSIIGKHGSSRILLKPASPGTGIIAGASIRLVLEQAGINNILTKRQGSKNIWVEPTPRLQISQSPSWPCRRRRAPEKTLK